MSARNAAPSNARATPRPLPLPTTWNELIRLGGPNALIAEAERQAGDREAATWLESLESAIQQLDPSEDFEPHRIITGWIETLRRRLHVRRPLDEVRAQTRERVRQFRLRRRLARALDPMRAPR